MSRGLYRLRVLIAGHGEEPPAETRVLFRQRVPWVALAGAFGALLCLPAYRSVLAAHVSTIVKGRLPTWGIISPGATPGSEDSPEPLRRELRRYPEDAHLQLAAPVLGLAGWPGPGYVDDGRSRVVDPTRTPDPRIDYMEDLQRRFPDDRIVLAQLLRYWSQNRIWTQRLESEGSVSRQPGALPTRALAPVVVSRIESIARDGARIDPQNACYPALLATAYAGAFQDEAALRELHRAATCNAWQDYSAEEGVAARELLIGAYGDQGLRMHVVPDTVTILGDLAEARSLARFAASKARQAGSRGDHAREHGIRLDVIRLGALMRRSEGSIVGRLSGAAVQRIGFGCPKMPKISVAPAEYLARVRKEAPQYANRIARELDGYVEFCRQRDRNMDYFDLEKNTFLPTMYRRLFPDLSGPVLLANGAAAFILWGLAAIVLGVRNSRQSNSPIPSRCPAPPPTRMIRALQLFLIALGGFGILSLSLGFPDIQWTGGDVVGFLIFASCAGVAFLPQRNGTIVWSGAHAAIVLLLAAGVGILAGAPWSSSDLQQLVTTFGHQWEFSPIDPGQVSSVVDLLWHGFLLVGGLLVASLGMAALRRAGFLGVFEALRAGARLAAGIIAVVYLALLLVTPPLSSRAARNWDRMIEQQIHRIPL